MYPVDRETPGRYSHLCATTHRAIAAFPLPATFVAPPPSPPPPSTAFPGRAVAPLIRAGRGSGSGEDLAVSQVDGQFDGGGAAAADGEALARRVGRSRGRAAGFEVAD